MKKILSQGAEAKIIQSGNFIIKDRVKKSYRLPKLDDKIRKQRTRSEIKLLEKASKIINAPHPLTDDFIGVGGRSVGGGAVTKIKMPFIKGKKLSESLNLFSLKEQKSICKEIGKNIAKLHDEKIIHGDLTTSNMILVDDKVFFIDFGLGFISYKQEDKAVDLHLLKQALEAKHFQHWQELWYEVERGYKSSKESKQVLERLKAVEKRGRYKEKY
jgi:TP53 regulating kinase-like protein